MTLSTAARVYPYLSRLVALMADLRAGVDVGGEVQHVAELALLAAEGVEWPQHPLEDAQRREDELIRRNRYVPRAEGAPAAAMALWPEVSRLYGQLQRLEQRTVSKKEEYRVFLMSGAGAFALAAADAARQSGLPVWHWLADVIPVQDQLAFALAFRELHFCDALAGKPGRALADDERQTALAYALTGPLNARGLIAVLAEAKS